MNYKSRTLALTVTATTAIYTYIYIYMNAGEKILFIQFIF